MNHKGTARPSRNRATLTRRASEGHAIPRLRVGLVWRSHPMPRRRALFLVLSVAFAASTFVHAQDRPAENATAARIADGVEKARAGKLLDAVEQFQRVLDTAGDELVPVDRYHHALARWVVHGNLAKLPAEGIKLYRQRVDGQAAKRLEEAKKRRDDDDLIRLLADMFAAKACEEAILELARRAFDRADFDAAEHYWQMLLPRTADDDRLLHFPTPVTTPAAVQARLILVKLFRGERDQAKADLKVVREQHAAATGLLNGKTGKYVDTLTELLKDPTKTTLQPVPDQPGWPTFAGAPTREGNCRAKLPYFWPDEPAWKSSLPFVKPIEEVRPDPTHPRSLAFHPVIADGRAYISDGARVLSVDLMTGKMATVAWPKGGEEARIPTKQDIRYTLTQSDGVLYARLGPAALKATDAGESGSFLLALGDRKGDTEERIALWKLDPPQAPDATTHFEGSPVVQRNRLYVAFWRSAGADAQAGIACYRIDDPKMPPELAWQRIVGKAGSEPNGETRYRHALVTVSGPNVVYCTDGGTVIALDAMTGRPSWEYRYPRNERPVLPRYRDLCPPLANGGHIYSAPADADRLLCLDAFTGRLIWEREGVEVVHLLGVARGRLIATFGGQGRGIRGLNLRTGADSGTGGWTIHDDGGEHTFGRGLVTEEAVVWPTKHSLHFLDPSDGTPLRSPIRGPFRHEQPNGVPFLREMFGNLCYADGVLLVTTATEVWGYVSEAKKLGDRRKAVEKETGNTVAHAELAQSLIDAGVFAEAEKEAGKAGDAKDRLRWLLAERVIRTGDKEAAKRIYDELAKGEGSFAAAGAVRLAEMCEEPEKKRELWRRVYAKHGTVRDENAVPYRASKYAEMRFGNLLAMHGTGVREDDFVGVIGGEPETPATHLARLKFEPMVSSTPSSQSNEIARLKISASDPVICQQTRPMFPPAEGNRIEPSFWQSHGNDPWVLFQHRIIVSGHGWEPSRPFIAPSNSTAQIQPQFCVQGPLAIAQTTAGRMLIWDNAQNPPRNFPSTSKPWPEPPVGIGDNRFLIPDDNAVVLFDAKAGKELARHTIPGADSLTGELPRFRIHQGDPLLLINRNHGVEMDRLQITDLKRVWREAMFVGRELDDVTFDGERFFTCADDTLSARWWKDGTPAWDIPLPVGQAFRLPIEGQAGRLPYGSKWKVAVSPQGLLVHPAEAIIQNPERDGFRELRQKGWSLDRLLRDVRRSYDVWTARELPVLLIDPADGRLIQRLTFPAAGPAAGVAVTPKGVVVVTGKGSWTLNAKPQAAGENR
jgi:outer membrane protein assembly factor BamB